MSKELKVIDDCYDLARYLSERVEKFSRAHCYTLGGLGGRGEEGRGINSRSF
jgi:hypothetical protein